LNRSKYHVVAAFLLLLAVISGCGTLASRSQILSIDSNPRGVEFSGAGEIGKGRTPQFVKVTRSSELRFWHNRTSETLARCNVRWAGSLAGNALGGYALGIFGGVAPFVQGSAAFSGVLADHFLGGLYTCPDHIELSTSVSAIVDSSSSSKDHPVYCRRFLVVPVGHSNSWAAARIREFWHEHARQRLQGCDQLIHTSDAQKLWDVLDYDNLNPPNLRHGGDFDKLHRIGFETGATHAVVLRYSERPDGVRILPQVYDLHRRVPSSRISADSEVVGPLEAAIEMPDTKVAAADQRWVASWFANHAPNSVEFSPARYTTLNNRLQTQGAVIQRSLRRRERFPTYVSSWQLTSAPSPAVYPKWGVEFGLRPSVATSYFYNEYVFSPEEFPGRFSSYSIETGYAAFVAKAVATAFTPVGSITAFMGAGPVAGVLREDEGNWRGFTATAGAVGFEYNLPVSDRWYVHGRAEGYALRSKITRGDVFDLNGWTTLSAGFGYFLPELRRGFSRWFL